MSAWRAVVRPGSVRPCGPRTAAHQPCPVPRGQAEQRGQEGLDRSIGEGRGAGTLAARGRRPFRRGIAPDQRRAIPSGRRFAARRLATRGPGAAALLMSSSRAGHLGTEIPRPPRRQTFSGRRWPTAGSDFRMASITRPIGPTGGHRSGLCEVDQEVRWLAQHRDARTGRAARRSGSGRTAVEGRGRLRGAAGTSRRPPPRCSGRR